MAAVIELLDPSLLSCGAAVELQGSETENSLRLGIQPEVHQIEVMGGLVDQKSSAVVLVAMPAAVVVCTVLGIQKPLEMHRCGSSDRTVADKLAHLGMIRGIAVVESHPDMASGLLLCIYDPLCLALIYGQRLFRNDITACFHRTADVIIVGTVDGGDNHDIGFCLDDHLLEFMRKICGNLLCTQFFQTTVGIVHPGLALVAESHHLCYFTVFRGHRLIIHTGSSARSDLCISFLCHKCLRTRHHVIGAGLNTMKSLYKPYFSAAVFSPLTTSSMWL